MPDPIHAAGSMPPPPEPWGTTDRERAAAKWLHSAHRGYWGWTDALPDARQLLAAVDGPEPDWADVREAARKAGFTLAKTERISKHWKHRTVLGRGRLEEGDWTTNYLGDHWISLYGRDGWCFEMKNPTPGQVLEAARLVGLDGGTP